MEKINFKRLLPVLATALVGTGYGIAKFAKTPDAAARDPLAKLTLSCIEKSKVN